MAPQCKSCHSDHFGWLAEQQCPGPENRVSLRAAWVRSLHHPPISCASCSSKAERPPDKRKTAERYRAGRPATGWCSQSARLAETQEVSAQFRLQWPLSLSRVESGGLVDVCVHRVRAINHEPSPLFLSVNATQLARPAFQAGPNRCKSDHGCHALKV